MLQSQALGHLSAFIYPRRTRTARDMVLGLCVCVCVSVHGYSGTTGYRAAYEGDFPKSTRSGDMV